MSKNNHKEHSIPKPWIAWQTDKDTVRVQIHDPDLAEAFKKEKGVERVGYAVGGGYMRIFAVQKPLEWVEKWMKAYARKVKSVEKPGGANQSK